MNSSGTRPIRDSIGELRIIGYEYEEVAPSEDHSLDEDALRMPNGTTIRIGLIYDRTPVGTVELKIGLYSVQKGKLPTQAPTCTARWERANCEVRNWTNDNFPDFNHTQVNLATYKEGFLPDAAPYPYPYGPLVHWTTIDLSGIPSLGYTVSGARAQVRFPGLWQDEPWVDPETYDKATAPPAVGASARFLFRNAQEFEWADDSDVEDDLDMLSWSYEVNGPDMLDPPRQIRGVREDALANNSRYTFVAGVILGVAGGVLIPAFEFYLRVIGSAFTAASLRLRRRLV